MKRKKRTLTLRQMTTMMNLLRERRKRKERMAKRTMKMKMVRERPSSYMLVGLVQSFQAFGRSFEAKVTSV